MFINFFVVFICSYVIITFHKGFIPVMIELILKEESTRRESQANEESNNQSKIDIKRVFLSDLMLLLNHNHNNCRYL